MRNTLSDQQRKFCVEYVKAGNATSAAKSAGYSVKTANEQGSQLLRKPLIAAEVARLTGKSEKNSESLVETLKRELVYIATVDPAEIWTDEGKLKPLSEIPERARRAISLIGDKGAKLHSKLGSIELLLKLMGELKQEQSAQQAVQIIIAAPPQVAQSPEPSGKLLPRWE
jgi:phage terminase small subunit